jgi:hypothetical protein
MPSGYRPIIRSVPIGKASRFLVARVAAAALFALVGWQAVTWLRAGHPDASQIRCAAVWAQMLVGFGLAALLVLTSWDELHEQR